MGNASAARWRRSPLGWLGLYLAVILVWMLEPDHPRIAGLFHDDGIYMCLGESLLVRGVYRDNHTPDPIQIAKYPPGVPCLAALTLGLAGDMEGALSLLRVLFAFFLVLALWSLLTLLREEGGTAARLAPWIVAATAFSPFLLDYVRVPMSEIPYTGISLFTLLYLTRSTSREERPWRHGTALAVLALLALFFRTVGGTLILTVATYLFLTSRRRTLLRFVLLALPVAVALQVFLAAQARPAAGFEDMTIYGLPYARILEQGLDWLPRIILFNLLRGLLYSLNTVVPVAIAWAPLEGSTGWLLLWLGALSVLVLVSLGLRREWKNPPPNGRPPLRPWHLHLALSLALVVPWPFEIARFLVPLIPFLLVETVLGARALAGRSGARIVAVLLLLAALAGTLMPTPLATLGGRWRQRLDHFTIEGYTRDLTPILSVGDSLSKYLRPDSVVASTLDPLFAAHFGVKGVWGWSIRSQCVDFYGGGRRPSRFFFDLDRYRWLAREMNAARLFFFEQDPGTDQAWVRREKARLGAAAVPAEGAAREWLLAEMEKERPAVRAQFRRVGVTHAILLLWDGQPLYDVLLARMVRELAVAGKAFPVTATPNGAIQVWRILP